MIKAIIIEDESLIAKELQYKLKELEPQLDILVVLPSVKTARKWFLENAEPDLVFADIQLNDGTSFEIFSSYQLKCPIIFTTAYDEYALQAFKVNGIDYLLKPIDDEELSKSLSKAKSIIESKSDYPTEINSLLEMIKNPKQNIKKYKSNFIVQYQKQWKPISTSDIACFIRENINYLYTSLGERYILEFATLEEIEAIIDPTDFYRANRQTIINYNAIHTIKAHENQKLTVTLKPPVKLDIDISREKAPQFKKWLDR